MRCTFPLLVCRRSCLTESRRAFAALRFSSLVRVHRSTSFRWVRIHRDRLWPHSSQQQSQPPARTVYAAVTIAALEDLAFILGSLLEDLLQELYHVMKFRARKSRLSERISENRLGYGLEPGKPSPAKAAKKKIRCRGQKEAALDQPCPCYRGQRSPPLFYP